MKTKKILILGRQGVGKTQLANLLSKALGIPITEEVECLGKLPNEEGIYTSNSIPIEVANVGLPQGFMLIQINLERNKFMEEFKGTKGRWQMTTSALECDHNSEVATIWGDSEYGEGASLIAHIDNSPGVEKALANAKLINAAPQLLEALQKVI